MTAPSTTDAPTYDKAMERAAAALMFREPQLARTTKTARAIAGRILDALIAADVTVETVTKPVAAVQGSLDENA